MTFPIRLSIWLLSCALLAIALPGCGLPMHLLLGANTTPSWQDSATVVKHFERYDIPPEQRFVLDTASYQKALAAWHEARQDTARFPADSLAAARKKGRLNLDRKNDLQPIQARYFNADGTGTFAVMNCYVSELFPPNWNVDQCLATFPPAPLADMHDLPYESLDFFLPHLYTSTGQPVTREMLPAADHYAVVFWNSVFYRYSRRLIEQMQEYNARYPEQTTFFLFVNNHNQTMWHLADDKNRQKAKKRLQKWEARTGQSASFSQEVTP